MTRKKTRLNRRTEESGFITETIRKSKLTASNGFELKKLARAQDGYKQLRFLPHFMFIIDESNLIMDYSIMEYLNKSDSIHKSH